MGLKCGRGTWWHRRKLGSRKAVRGGFTLAHKECPGSQQRGRELSGCGFGSSQSPAGGETGKPNEPGKKAAEVNQASGSHGDRYPDTNHEHSPMGSRDLFHTGPGQAKDRDGLQGPGAPRCQPGGIAMLPSREAVTGVRWQGSVRYAFLAPVTASSDPCHALDVPKWGSG